MTDPIDDLTLKGKLHYLIDNDLIRKPTYKVLADVAHEADRLMESVMESVINRKRDISITHLVDALDLLDIHIGVDSNRVGKLKKTAKKIKGH